MSIVSVDNIQPIGSGTTVTVNKSVTLESGNTNITGVCTATSFSGSGANLTSLPSQVTINGAGSNRLITSDSGTTLNCESSLTYDGTTLQAITALSGTREQLNLKNQNASAGTSRINFFSTVSGTEFACAAIRNGVNTLNQGRLFLQTNKGSGLTNSLELDQSGNATITDGNLVIGTAGHGIDFSVTSSNGVGELLDDYEYGSWTPTISAHLGGGSFTTNAAGRYVKVGRLVSLWGQLSWSAKGGSGVVNLNMTGLPFATHNTAANNSAVCIGSRSGWNNLRLIGQMAQSGYINVQYINSSGNSANVNVSALDNSGSIYYRFQYESAT